MPLLFFLQLPIFRRFAVSSIGRSECIISRGIPFYEILPSTSDKLMVNAKPIKVEIMVAEDYLTVISELQVHTIELISQSFGIEQAPKLTLALRRRSHGNEMAMTPPQIPLIRKGLRRRPRGGHATGCALRVSFSPIQFPISPCSLVIKTRITAVVNYFFGKIIS